MNGWYGKKSRAFEIHHAQNKQQQKCSGDDDDV